MQYIRFIIKYILKYIKEMIILLFIFLFINSSFDKYIFVRIGSRLKDNLPAYFWQ